MKRSRLDVTSGAALFYPLLYFLDEGGWFSAALPGIVLHELGHWAALRLLGGRLLCLRLEVPGLCMETTPLPSPGAEALILLAGPAAGSIWGLAALSISGPWWEKSARTALALSLFNLLPALPLDGGRLLLALGVSWDLCRAFTLLCALGFIAGALLWRLWGLILPALLLFRAALTA